MPIYKGTTEIENILKGTTEIQAVYQGTIEKWSNNKAIKLGNGQSFNVANVYPKYSELTNDNFFFISATGTTVYHDMGHEYWAPTGYWERDISTPKSYNNSNGILSFKVLTECNDRTMGQGSESGTNLSAVLITKPTKLINLGGGTTFNLSSYQGYQNFTADNFMVKEIPRVILESGRYNAGDTKATKSSFTKSYNQSTGILTFYFKLHDSDNPRPMNVYLYKGRI